MTVLITCIITVMAMVAIYSVMTRICLALAVSYKRKATKIMQKQADELNR